MKNIHVLPTPNPSRLHFTEFEEELVFTPQYEKLGGVNIYITSNEALKEGDWFYDGDGELCKYTSDYVVNPNGWNDNKKIILTTDQDLIKDGVQAIDDEFLEWFVKNPSCEFVEVERDSREVGGHNGGVQIEYGYYEIIISEDEPKQETLEEVAKKYVKDKIGQGFYPCIEIAFEDGYKLAQEQNKNVYSDEEVLTMLLDCRSENPIDVNKWFNQFKKK